MKLNIPVRDNKKLENILKKVRSNVRLTTYLECCNITAIDRMHINDHGPIHVTIVSNIALKMLRNLIDAGVEPGIVKHHEMANEDAEVVVLLGSLLHDIGMIVHRDNHHIFSIPIALDLLKDILKDVYDEKEEAILTAEILHTIISHDAKEDSLSPEAGVVRIADALDMKQGRARIPFKEGAVNIHSVSAMSIEDIVIGKGEKPIEITITMSNSAGIFQIDELLARKLRGSGLQDHIKITAQIEGEEKKIIDRFDVK